MPLAVCTVPVESLWSLCEGVHRLLDLQPVRLVQDRGDDLLHPHSPLPADLLLLLGGPAPSEARVIVAVPASYIPRGVADALDALRAPDLHGAEIAGPLDLFKDSKVRLGSARGCVRGL